MAEPSLGLVMILKDEAPNLGRSLAPVAALFDEVVVVDTGSRDGTPEICARLGARVYDFAWRDDFAAARNYSLEKSRADWVFWLDGDNAISAEAVAGLRGIIAGLEGPAVLWARELVEPGGACLWQKRGFARSPEVRFRGRVHEQLRHPGHWPSVRTPVVVRHWGYSHPREMERKGRYYLELLERMLKEDPRDFYAHFQAARCHINLRRDAEALPHLDQLVRSRRARRDNPQLWEQGFILQARAWQRLGRPERALRALEVLLEQVPESVLGHYHLGRLAYGLGDWALAARHLGLVEPGGLSLPLVEVDTDKVLFLADYFRGRALEHLGRVSEAARVLARAAAREPSNPAPRTDLARVLMALGQRDRARRELQRVLEQRPRDRQARRLLERLEEAA